MEDDEVSDRHSKFICDCSESEVLVTYSTLNEQFDKWNWFSGKGCALEKDWEVIVMGW